jgi:hypothetical protein
MAMISGSTIAAPGTALTLVREGTPAAEIILSQTPTKAARLGAYELQHHVKLITGAELPIINGAQVGMTPIFVGDSPDVRKLGVDCSQLGKQEYLVKFFPKALVLAGKDREDLDEPVYDYLANKAAVHTWPSLYHEVGSMHAVYDFLETHCGVRWINPSDHGTLLTKANTLVVSGSELRQKPYMIFRGGAAAFDVSQRYNRNGGLWHVFGPKSHEPYNSRAYGKVWRQFSHPHHRTAGMRAQNRLFMYRMKAGGESSACNHSFYDFYPRFWEKVNDQFEERKSEYFAEGYEGQPPQLCYSNDATVAQVVHDARGYFDNGGIRGVQKWGENFYALEPMDNNSFCKCRACASQFEPDRAKDRSQHSTYWFRFVNRVAREIRKSHPDKQISTLAYMSHEGLPAGFKLEDNVVVHFCVYGNRTPFNATLLEAQINRLKEWTATESVPMYLWLYGCFPSLHARYGKFHCFPGFFPREAKRQYALFKQLGVRGIFYDGFTCDVDNYVGYKLMEEPDRDVDELLTEYFSVYGAAGKPLREMSDIIEERYCNPANYPQRNGVVVARAQTPLIAWGHLGTTEVMAALQDCMDRAHAAAKTDQQKQLVQLWDDAVWTYMKAGRESFVERMSFPIPDITAPRVAAAAGDVNKVNWDQARSLGGKWYKNGRKDPAALKLDGRICHDGTFLFLELTDLTDPKRLEVSPMISCYDDWELFIAGQRAQPFRQYLVGPTGMTMGLSYGEVNWRQKVLATEYTEKAFGMQAVSNTDEGKWVVRLCFALNDIIERPVKPGDDIYMNILRIMNPELCGEPGARYGIDTWSAFTTVHEVDRLGRIHLE